MGLLLSGDRRGWAGSKPNCLVGKFSKVASALVICQNRPGGTFRTGIGETSMDIDATEPIPAIDSVFIEELTWVEVRDAIEAGKNRQSSYWRQRTKRPLCRHWKAQLCASSNNVAVPRSLPDEIVRY